MVVEQMSHWRLVKDFPITKVMMGFKIYIKLKKVWLQSTILRWRTIRTTKQTNLLESFFKNQEKIGIMLMVFLMAKRLGLEWHFKSIIL